MAPPAGRRTEEGFRRLIAFSDAVVAIALTLLVLPLTEIGGELAGESSVFHVLSDNSDTITGFLISFAVIWVLWRNHHRVMENFCGYDRILFDLHLVWLFTIVVLPFATALISGPRIRWATAFYILVLMVSIACLVAMAAWGKRHRQLLDTGPEVDAWIDRPPDLGTVIMLAIAFVVALVFPQLGSWSLLLLFGAGPVDAAIGRALSRRAQQS